MHTRAAGPRLGDPAVHGKERADTWGYEISIGAQAGRQKKPAASYEVVRFDKRICKRVVWVKGMFGLGARTSTPLGTGAWGRLTIGRQERGRLGHLKEVSWATSRYLGTYLASRRPRRQLCALLPAMSSNTQSKSVSIPPSRDRGSATVDMEPRWSSRHVRVV